MQESTLHQSSLKCHKDIEISFHCIALHCSCNAMQCNATTVPLLKSCHRRRSLFLITDGHHILHELIGHCSMFHRPPVKIFLLYDQKCGQMRQSNIPPLFSRRRSAAYWAEIWPANAVAIVTSISCLPSSYLSVWFSSYFLVYMHLWLFWPT